jgi:hypothetical protein
VVLIRLIITNRPYISLFIEEGGWTLYTTEFRANFANLANKHSTKLGTLIYSAYARTVRPTGADCPDRGLSGLRAEPSARSFWCQTYAPLPFGGARQTKSILTRCDHIGFLSILPHTRMVLLEETPIQSFG